MAPALANNGTSANTQQDPTVSLINASVATTALAVESKLDSLLNTVTSPSTGNIDIDKALEGIRIDLESLTSTQSGEREEIKRHLEDALNTEVLEYLTREIESQIDASIEKNVAGLVEVELDKYIPKPLREKVDAQRMDIQSLHVQIHNTEARRSNSFIKTQKQFGEDLHHLINGRGSKCDLFPKTVKDLLELEDPKIVELVGFYGFKDPVPGSRAANLNWFLREIGVTYQSNFLG